MVVTSYHVQCTMIWVEPAHFSWFVIIFLFCKWISRFQPRSPGSSQSFSRLISSSYWLAGLSIIGAYHLAIKIQKFWLKVKWNCYSNFVENLLGNCRLPPDLLLFFCSEQNGGNFLYHLTIMGNWIVNGLF